MKEFLAAHTVEALGIIIAAITAIGVFVGPWLASRRQRRIGGEDRKLRAHFEELKRQAEDLISLASSLQEKDVRIVVADTSAAELGVSYMQIRGMQQISDSLEAHFSREMGEWRKWMQKTIEHNTKCEDFCRKIKMAFESKGIPVVQNDQGNHSICIFEAALHALFTRWKELARSNHPWPDFQKIESEPVKGGYLLYASGWRGNAVAFAKTEDEREKCESALAEVAKDEENQGEAAKLYDSANELVEQAKGFADQFASKLNDMDTFWPPKKPNEFKELKKTCPRCKEVF